MMGLECRERSLYHLSDDFELLEYLAVQSDLLRDRSITQPKARKTTVATALNNKVSRSVKDVGCFIYE